MNCQSKDTGDSEKTDMLKMDIKKLDNIEKAQEYLFPGSMMTDTGRATGSRCHSSHRFYSSYADIRHKMIDREKKAIKYALKRQKTMVHGVFFMEGAETWMSP